MTDAAVVSQQRGFALAEPCSGPIIADALVTFLRNLGQRLNRQGKIIGHLKAMAVSGEHYIQVSLTSLPKVGTKADPDWYGQEFRRLEVTINLIVFGFSEAQLRGMVEESLEGTVFSSPGVNPS